MRSIDRWRPRLGWVGPAAVASALLIAYVLRAPPGLSADTIALVHGAHTISYCLAHGIFTKCDRVAPWTGLDGVSTDVYNGVLEGAVAPYPLFQYIPAMISEHLGFGQMSVFRILELINLVSVCGVVWLAAWLASKTGKRWAPALAVLLFTTSPLLIYARQTFGEALASLILVTFAAGALRRWRPLGLGASAAIACLTKETLFPIVLLVGAAALYATPVAVTRLRRGHWVGLITGVLAGVVISTLFDVFRYGQLTNFTYGHSYEQVPGLARRLGLAVAVWLAPNGGLAEFWGLAALLICGLLLATVLGRGLPAVARFGRLPGAALLVALLILTGTLASWYSPFGWIAWGPRLMLPVVSAVSLVILILYAPAIEGILGQLVRDRAAFAVLAVAVVAFAVPEVNILHATQTIGNLFTPDATCPTSPSPATPAYYYNCIYHYAWDRHWLLLNTFQALNGIWGKVFLVLFAGAWLWLVENVRRGFSTTAVTDRVAPDRVSA